MKKLLLTLFAFGAIVVSNAGRANQSIIDVCEKPTSIVLSQESVDSTVLNAWGGKFRESPFSLGLSAQSKYIWRGMEMQTEDAAPTLFPSVDYTYGGLYVYAMGGYSLNGKYAEVDYGISYTWKCVSFGINDYYYPTTTVVEDNYFNYRMKSTGHWLEASVTIAPEKIPASLTVSNFFAGADKTLEGNQAYSTYAELSTWYDFLKGQRISVTCGVAFNKSCYNNYSRDFGVCNLEAKYTYNVELNNGKSMPLSCSYILNPIYKKAFVNLTANIAF